ncbi:hypothetical protein [Pseudolysinimonas sp.]
MDQPTAENALARLERLVGTWEVEATWPENRIGPAHGTTTIAWHDSKAHLVVRSTVDLPEVPDSTSIIGCDGASDAYVQLYADSRGVSRVFRMSIDEREWMLWRDGIPFAQRFVVHASDDGDTMTGGWEIEEDGVLHHDFAIVYRRVR